MRISYLHGSSDLYGASQMLLQEVAAAMALGHDASVSLPAGGPLVRRLIDLGADVQVDTGMKVLRAVQPLDCVRAAGAGVPDADLVVLWTMALLPEARRLRRAGQRVALSVHELLLSRSGTVLARYVSHLGVPVQYNSKAVGRWLLSNGVHSDLLHLAYPAVAPQRAVNRRTEPPSPEAPFTMLLMGRINGRKGHLDAARAVTALCRPDVRLLLAGSPFPGQEGRLRELEAFVNSKPEVQLRGQVDDIRRLALEVDVVLTLPNRPEPLGLQPFEFWSMGVRSAGWAWGGQAEVLDLVEGVALPHQPAHLSEWLSLLVQNWAWVASSPTPTVGASVECSRERRTEATRDFLSACVAG
jgi:glycosyltransferase involved in cell wall biosynthesis